MFRVTNPSSAFSSNEEDPSALDASTCRQQALARSSRKLERHHPNVKLPPRLDEKSKEEQIQRCCDRFKSFPATVDTLIRALQTILSNPAVRKYRRIDQTNPGYQRSLAGAPGAEQLLLALGFRRMTDEQSLVLDTVNRDLLQMALGALNETTKTPEYQHAKKELVFRKDVAAHLRATPTAHELTARQTLLSKVPREPAPGRSAVMMIHLGGNDDNSRTLTRRFDGDDTLQDVLHWLAGTVGTIFYQNLVESRSWSLVDVNRLGETPINCDAPVAAITTLQHLGFWPSGRLQLRPSTVHWMKRQNTDSLEMGVSRGLASAPSETLKYI
ncbi:expressed unknown protein [Seminavis robusta]|uniref:PUB domain-containing protein n=1 Tax=Seminavis robusta TaxID=568900 RepID=A0A9N8HHJ5_9STRA|nr:expressed unknown protein [Seminavis robusta]|eukprot:Sro451_g145770.1 n/a (328) ;mRNA; r:58019-59002